jgi:hypothetical protein
MSRWEGGGYPPLTGGMIATSSLGEMVAVSRSMYSRFIATATAERIFFCASLGCFCSRSAKKSLIVRVDLEGSGNAIVSVDRPVVSFADAKYRTLKVCLLKMEGKRGIRERNRPFRGR